METDPTNVTLDATRYGPSVRVLEGEVWRQSRDGVGVAPLRLGAALKDERLPGENWIRGDQYSGACAHPGADSQDQARRRFV